MDTEPHLPLLWGTMFGLLLIHAANGTCSGLFWLALKYAESPRENTETTMEEMVAPLINQQDMCQNTGLKMSTQNEPLQIRIFL